MTIKKKKSMINHGEHGDTEMNHESIRSQSAICNPQFGNPQIPAANGNQNEKEV